MNTTKVLIIGAGAAGIATASWLAEKGFTDFIILEAEDRIGGRIYTTKLGDATIEKGCQWVHGEKGNVVFEMANPLGLLEDSVINLFDNGCVSDGSGKRIDVDICAKFWAILRNLEEEHENDMRIFKGSVYDFYLQEYKKTLKEEGIDFDSSPLAEPFLQLYRKLQESVDGCDSLTEPSCRGHVEYWTCEGNLLVSWKKGGYHNIIDILTKRCQGESKELPVRSKVQLNKEVVSVQWEGTHTHSDRVVTSCADGSVYVSDHVLVTVSLGVLKHKCHSLFQPPLPAYKLTTIQGFGFGTVDKIFLRFPHQWWPDEENFFSILWTAEAIKSFHLEEEDESSGWLRDVFTFHPVDHAPNVLLGWVVGQSARHMETLPLSTVMEGCMKLLQHFFGKLYDIPPAVEVVRSTWSTNQHFRGSYSFWSLDADDVGATPALLTYPLVNSQDKPVVMFAGEATHDHYYSTVHGAVESGFREAKRLARLLGVGSRCPVKCCVVVVGAGIAGLAAARTLLEGGVADIVMLEAQAQAGGRIQSVPVGDGWVEAGAQWVHGQNHAVWCLANDKGLLSDCISAEGEGPYLQEGGCEVELSVVQEVGGVVGDIMEQCSQFFLDEQLLAPESVGTFLHSRFQEYVQHCGCGEEGRRLRWQLYDWHLRFYVIDNSCLKLDNLSAKAYGTYLFSGGKDYMNFKNGYSSLIEALVEDIPAEKLHFNCPVSTIHWNKDVDVGNGLHMCGNSAKPSVLVSCANGLQFKAEHVIVTCSLGYLKEHHASMFLPGLPATITQAIEDMGFATINKVFLIYDTPWWQTDTKGFQIVWPLHDSQFLTKNESRAWLRDLSGFDVLPDRDAVLLGWVGGEGAKAMEELTEEQVGRHCTQLLRHFTGRPNIPPPRTTIRSQWHKNPYIRGGYSNNSNLCDKSCRKPSDLSQPVYTYVASRKCSWLEKLLTPATIPQHMGRMSQDTSRPAVYWSTETPVPQAEPSDRVNGCTTIVNMYQSVAFELESFTE